VRKRSRSAWWRSGAEVCSWVVPVLVPAPVVFGCDAPGASVGLPLLAMLVVLLGRSLGSWVFGLVDAASIWSYWKQLLSNSARSLCWRTVIAVEESASSMDLIARAPLSSPALLLRELVALLVLVLGLLLLLDMAGGGCGGGRG
jgi:hypothetical protein